jgi:uncharacterized protein YjbI with pentapeptide repeats
MAESQESPAQNATPAPEEEGHSRGQSGLDFREAELRCQKLELETQLLRRQASARFFWLEVAKAITGPAALLDLMVTIYIGTTQLKQAQRSRDDDRFDRAVARLASPRTTERVAGVVGLQLFLGPDQRDRHRATLQFLSNALVTERDATERHAILDTFAQLAPKEVGQDVLNATLETLRDKNRSLFGLHRGKEVAKEIAERTGRAKKTVTEPGEDSGSDEESSALRATASAIAVLVRRGARIKDLSGIYCGECDFSGTALDDAEGLHAGWYPPRRFGAKSADVAHIIDLSGTDFHDSILTNADFTGVTLRDSDFDSASIDGATFYGADLSRAKITSHRDSLAPLVGSLEPPEAFPDFNCADLEGADFTRTLLFGIVRTRESQVSRQSYPFLRNANLAHAKLEKIHIFIITPAPRSDEIDEPKGGIPFEGAGMLASMILPKPYLIEARPSRVTIVEAGADIRVREPIRPDDMSSMYRVFAELASARNIEQSDLSPHIKEFIQRNKGTLLRSIDVFGNESCGSAKSEAEKN